jgi:3-hydroxyisobutyrate dehydrogenase
MRITLLGTGIMGAPMARNLAQAGTSVRAWNRTGEKAEALAEHGVAVADSPADAVAGADVVVTVLADADAVESAVTEGGALEAMGDDAVWSQMSTVGLKDTERLSRLAERRGVAYVDAPVLGTRQPAEEGALVVIAAGPRPALERCRPVFDVIGSKTIELEEVGEATCLKLAVNTWVMGIVETLAETIALARSLGVDPRCFLEAIEGGPLDCGYAHLKGGLMLDESFEPPAFPLRLAVKDARLVLEAAQAAGIDLPLARAVRGQLERAAEAGHGEEDLAAVYRVLAG